MGRAHISRVRLNWNLLQPIEIAFEIVEQILIAAAMLLYDFQQLGMIGLVITPARHGFDGVIE